VAATAAVRKEQRELVASEAGNGIALPYAGLKAPCHPLEQKVSEGMTQGIVDQLEAIHIQEEHGRASAMSTGQRQRHAKPILEEQPVGEARESIVVGEETDALLRSFPLGNLLLQLDVRLLEQPRSIDQALLGGLCPLN